MIESIVLLIMAALMAILTYTKPKFFWYSSSINRARKHSTDAQIEREYYRIILLVVGIAIAMILFSLR